MNNKQIDEIIRKSLPGIKKDIVALKAWKDEPKGVPKFEGRAFPGICSNIGEVLITKETHYVTEEQCYCAGGVMSFGLRKERNKQEWGEVHKSHLSGDPRGHKDSATAAKYYEGEEKRLSPFPKEKYAAVQVGLLKDIPEPDVVLIFCNPQDGDVINRAYTWPTGEMMMGYGSHGGCTFTLRLPFVSGKPTFSIGDTEWRHYIGLEDPELTISVPFKDFDRWIENLPLRAEYYTKYRQAIAFRRYRTPREPQREVMARFLGDLWKPVDRNAVK
jgi:uncharacterized protein (DUF169 family)